MHMEISQQALLLLHVYALLLGGILGLLYDGFRITRIFFGAHYSRDVAKRMQSIKLPLLKAGKSKKESRLIGLVVFFEDLLFCLLSAVAVIFLFYELNNGKFRFVALCCIGAGFLLYRVTLGRLVMLCSEGVAFVLEVALRYLLLFFCFPFRLLYGAIRKGVLLMIMKARKRRQRAERIRYTEFILSQLSKNACGMLEERSKEETVYKKGKRYGRGKEKTIQSEPVDKGSVSRHSAGIHRNFC